MPISDFFLTKLDSCIQVLLNYVKKSIVFQKYAAEERKKEKEKTCVTNFKRLDMHVSWL